VSTLASLMVLFKGDASDLTRTMDHVEQRAGRMGGVMNNVMQTAGGFLVANVAMRGFAMATDFAGEALIGYNARMEQAQIGFTTLLGSAEKATSFIKDLQQFANKTPFDFPGLQKAANQMLAMGFNADEILPTLTAVGDATAALGLGSEGVQRATYALGQMRAAGRVNAQDMMQLTSMGIPAWKMLADSMGKTVPEVRKLSEKGLIPAKQGLDAILNGIKNGNMGGMMAEQAKTFNGSIATIQDTLMQLISGALQPLFAHIRDITVAFSEWVQSPAAAQIGKVIGAGVAGVEKGIGLLIKVVGPAVSLMTELFGKVQSVVSVFNQVGGALGFGPAVQGVLKQVVALGDAFWDFVDKLIPNLILQFNILVRMLPGILSKALDAVFEFVNQVADAGMAMAMRFADSLLANAPALAAAMGGFLQTAFDWIINEGVPKAAAAIGPLALKFIDWLFVILPKLLDALDVFIGVIFNFIVTNAPVLAGKLIEWAIAFVSFIATEVVPRLIANLPTILRVILLFLGGAASKLLGKMAELGSGMVGQLMGYLLALPAKAAGVFANVISRAASWVSQMLVKATATGKGFVDNIMNFLIGIPGKIGQTFANALATVARFVSQFGQAALDAGAKFVGNIVRGLASLPGALLGAISRAVRSVLPFSLGPLTIGRNAITLDLGPAGHQTLASYAKGSGSVSEGLAYLHEDEAVVPKNVNRWLHKNGYPTAAAASGGLNVNVTLPGATRPITMADVSRDLRLLNDLGYFQPDQSHSLLPSDEQ
jgi:tape measure domain-containing protein